MRPSENIEKLIKNVKIETNAKTDHVVIADVVKAFEESKKKGSAFTQPSMWSIIMKNRITKLAAMVAIIGVFVFLLFFGSGQATLYAQVMKAFEQAKTIYAVGYSLEDGQMKKASELWYQQGLGLRIEEIHRDRNRAKLDDGQYEWEYLQGNDFAVQTESSRQMRLPGELTEPSGYLKECTRDLGGDMEVEGFTCRLYTSTRLGDDKKPVVKSMMWIDEQMRFRRYEEQKFVDGLWQTIELATISYNIPIESRMFAADFGPGIEVIKPQDVVKNLFALEGAIATKELMGLVFAVHELKRNGNYIFTTCSIRPTENTREQIRNYRSSDNNKDIKHYGDIYLTGWWQRKENGDIEERPYAHTILSYYQVNDVLIRCFASMPKGQWEGVDKEFDLNVGIFAIGKLRELLLSKGQSSSDLTKTFRVLLPLPAEDTPIDEVTSNLYETAKLMASLKPTRLEPRPTNITSQGFALEMEKKLRGLRPMNEVWESVGSNVVVKLIDPNGQPIPEAKVGSDIRSHDGQLYWYYQDWQRDCAVSDADGKVILQGQQIFHPAASRQSSCMLYAVQQEKRLAGVVPITDEDFGKTVTLIMQPACRVYGRFVCPELSDNGDALNKSINTYLSFFGKEMMYHVLSHSTDKREFEALLVPGRYEMSCQSYDANRKWAAQSGQLLEVPESKRELDLGNVILKLKDYK